MGQFQRSLRSALTSALLLTVSTLSESARADEEYQVTNDVVLTDVRVSSATSSERSHIMFVLENRSAEWIRFGGIEISGAGRSRIIASVGSGVTTTFDSVPVAPGKVLSADGKALWIEVDGLPSPQGGKIEATVSVGTAAVQFNLPVSCEIKPSS
ncbi:hypothetical protein [Microvirga rosea]|uniref:hypothetical protein n=1 Tax=Microvirga rosea TaxID=2715425 RepID=UPI001D0BBD4C|nr:hypothetical protein [Microvirga rosea]MCB8822005.1 hypothetical protein [Microvirga rosea]